VLQKRQHTTNQHTNTPTHKPQDGNERERKKTTTTTREEGERKKREQQEATRGE
jgi:hypothetical protein